MHQRTGYNAQDSVRVHLNGGQVFLPTHTEKPRWVLLLVCIGQQHT
jgi:hypothetical protein